jgi:hypothetical protein
VVAEEELARGLALRSKIEDIISRADARRRVLVEEITVAARPEALDAIMRTLELVSPTLRRLVIRSPHQGVGYKYDQYDNYYQGPALAPSDTLDVRLIMANLYFPSLTYIRICGTALRYVETLALLCRSAPNLRTIDATVKARLAPVIKGAENAEDEEEAEHAKTDSESPPLQADINVRRMCLDAYDSGDRDWEADPAVVPTTPVIDLVKRCSHLEELSLTYVNYDNWPGGTGEEMGNTIASLPVLRDLHWEVELGKFAKKGVNVHAPYPSLRRLAIRATESSFLMRTCHHWH